MIYRFRIQKLRNFNWFNKYGYNIKNPKNTLGITVEPSSLSMQFQYSRYFARNRMQKLYFTHKICYIWRPEGLTIKATPSSIYRIEKNILIYKQIFLPRIWNNILRIILRYIASKKFSKNSQGIWRYVKFANSLHILSVNIKWISKIYITFGKDVGRQNGNGERYIHASRKEYSDATISCKKNVCIARWTSDCKQL